MQKSICSTLTRVNLKRGKIYFLDLLFERWRKTKWWANMHMPQRAALQFIELCCSLNRQGCREAHVGVRVGVEGSQRFPFPVFFPLCVLHPGRHPVCNKASWFVSGQGWVAKSTVCEITHTWMISVLFVCLAVFVYMSTVCVVGAGALLSQPITFTSTPNLSWVSRVRVKAEEVTTRKWLLPHHKWEEKGQWLGKKVAVVLLCGQSKTVRMGKLINK